MDLALVRVHVNVRSNTMYVSSLAQDAAIFEWISVGGPCSIWKLDVDDKRCSLRYTAGSIHCPYVMAGQFTTCLPFVTVFNLTKNKRENTILFFVCSYQMALNYLNLELLSAMRDGGWGWMLIASVQRLINLVKWIYNSWMSMVSPFDWFHTQYRKLDHIVRIPARSRLPVSYLIWFEVPSGDGETTETDIDRFANRVGVFGRTIRNGHFGVFVLLGWIVMACSESA